MGQGHGTRHEPRAWGKDVTIGQGCDYGTMRQGHGIRDYGIRTRDSTWDKGIGAGAWGRAWSGAGGGEDVVTGVLSASWGLGIGLIVNCVVNF